MIVNPTPAPAPAPAPAPQPVFKPIVKPQEARPAYPTSNPKKKNWDQLAKDLGEDDDDDKKSGSNPMAALFNTMYQKADD